jgi:hypothetical protein
MRSCATGQKGRVPTRLDRRYVTRLDAGGLVANPKDTAMNAD